jgi:hypothetical protein
MRYWLIFGLFLVALNCFSQEKPVEGIVFDKLSKERVASINIHDITKHISVYNNLKGEFSIKASDGDQLVFTRSDYRPDTVKVQGKAPLAIYMAHLVIQLREVTVRDSNLTPQQKLQATRNDYTKIYGPSGNPDWFDNGSYGGAGLSIDALWNAFSREGRNASRLRDIIERDYEQNVIDYRFSRGLVGRITGLKDARLTSFMFRYRPGYYTASTMNDYEFITMIKANLRRFLRNQRTYSLPPLQSK